jgi:L-iditol 2-dehydrogenase
MDAYACAVLFPVASRPRLLPGSLIGTLRGSLACGGPGSFPCRLQRGNSRGRSDGLLLLQVARLAGADPIFITDKLSWRLQLAERLGGIPIPAQQADPVSAIHKATAGRGVDVAIEAAWGDQSVAQAAEMARLGGRLVLVGIPSDDRLHLKHSTARRKGLTIRMSRRMRLVYPRVIRLAEQGRVELNGLVSHRFPLSSAPRAFALNAQYDDNVIKVVIES